MKISKYLQLVTISIVCALFWMVPPLYAQNAQRRVPIRTAAPVVSPTPVISATPSAMPEASAASIIKKVIEKQPDITDPNPIVKGKLERLLETNPVGPLTPFNAVRHGIRNAVTQGVPANTIVLLLLFPLIATVIVIARHIIGLKSFGIFTPALLSVAFLATGLTTGIALFIVIFAAATLSRIGLQRIRIQYLPRMAMFILFVSLALLATLFLSPLLGRVELVTIGIFPLLILILLVEDFLDLQITRSFYDAVIITLQTLVMAIICYFLMNLEILQRYALVNPELYIATLFLVILVVERYAGLRLLEIWRFRKLINW